MATQLGIIEIYGVDDVSIKGHFISLYEKNVYNPTNLFGASVVMELWQNFGGIEDHPLAEVLNEAAENTTPKLLEPYIQKVTFSTPNGDDTQFEITVKDTSLLSFVEAGLAWDSYYLG